MMKSYVRNWASHSFFSIYTYIVKSEKKTILQINQILHIMNSSKSVLFSLSLIAPSDLQLPLRQ